MKDIRYNAIKCLFWSWLCQAGIVFTQSTWSHMFWMFGLFITATLMGVYIERNEWMKLGYKARK